jgi:hypothetical protein
MLEISINNSNFLWMTRGKKWGFRFLSKCSLLASASETVYKTVFLRDDSRFGYWKGFVFLDGRKQPYVACRCHDSTIQRDEAGRRIPHDFLLLCSDEEFKLLNGVAWESLILDQVRGLYAERYPRCSNEVTDCLINFKIRLNSEVQPSNSCATLNVPVLQSDRETQPPQRRFPGNYLFPILLICLGVGYVSMHHREKSEPSIYGEATSMSESEKEGDSADIAVIGPPSPSADSVNTPNLDSDESVVFEGMGAEEGGSSSGGMWDDNSFAESQPEAANVAGNEHFENALQETSTELAPAPSDTGSWEEAKP